MVKRKVTKSWILKFKTHFEPPNETFRENKPIFEKVAARLTLGIENPPLRLVESVRMELALCAAQWGNENIKTTSEKFSTDEII